MKEIKTYKQFNFSDKSAFFIIAKSSRYFAEPYRNIDLIYQFRPLPRFIFKFFNTVIDIVIIKQYRHKIVNGRTVTIKRKSNEA